MLPHEVTHRTVSGIRKDVASRCDVSVSAVGMWCIEPKNQDGPGEKSPFQRVIEMFWSAVLAGERERAVDAIQYIAGECGGVFVPNSAVADPTSLDVTANIVREFGEMLTATSLAINKGHLGAAEAEAILPEIDDVLSHLLPFRRTVHAVTVVEEAGRERTRKGPHRPLSALAQLRSAGLRISVA